jgi:hypothetical protein
MTFKEWETEKHAIMDELLRTKARVRELIEQYKAFPAPPEGEKEDTHGTTDN